MRRPRHRPGESEGLSSVPCLPRPQAELTAPAGGEGPGVTCVPAERALAAVGHVLRAMRASLPPPSQRPWVKLQPLH